MTILGILWDRFWDIFGRFLWRVLCKQVSWLFHFLWMFLEVGESMSCFKACALQVTIGSWLGVLLYNILPHPAFLAPPSAQYFLLCKFVHAFKIFCLKFVAPYFLYIFCPFLTSCPELLPVYFWLFFCFSFCHFFLRFPYSHFFFLFWFFCKKFFLFPLF